MLDDASVIRVSMDYSVAGVLSQQGFCTSGAVAIPSRNPRWYAVVARSGQEKRAAEELRRQGFQVFCPLVARPPKARDKAAIQAAIARAAGKRLRGRKPQGKPVEAAKPTTLPLLRGYVFVELDLLVDTWGTIRSTRGVASSEDRSAFLCMRPGHPFPIPDRQIKAMQDEVMKLGQHADLVRALMRAGEIVRVAEGPFSNHAGKVLRQIGDDVWLQVEIFGRPSAVQLKVGQVERVS